MPTNGHSEDQTCPLVSVIIPFFNRIGLAQRAVRSVFAQTYPNIEIIVVNDGSSESDAALVELFSGRSDLVYIKTGKNVGPGQARNIGIQSSKGRYIAFLDADDSWEEDKLKIQVCEMLTKGWSFSHTSYYRHDTTSGQTKIVRSGSRNYVFPLAAFSCRIATPSVVLERALLSDRSFRSDLRFGEDTFLWLALSKRTTLYGIDRPLTHVFTGDLTTATNATIHSETLQVAREGLEGHRFLLVVHAVYRVFRKVQKQMSRPWGQ